MKISTMTKLCLALILVLIVLPSCVFSHGGHHEESGNSSCMPNWACYNHPSCTPEKCIFSFQWKVEDEFILFNLTAITDGYIAIGFSMSGKMTDAEVYSCNKEGELLRGWNLRHNYNADTLVPGTVSNQHVIVQDGIITCQFQRVLKLDSGPSNFLDLTSNHSYTILAVLYKDVDHKDHPGHPVFHRDNHWNSKDKIDFSVNGNAHGEGRGEFIPKLHGILMTLAWLGFAAIGITSSRYYKPIWPETTLWGKPVWFTIHRTCMVAAFLCFLFAGIVIVVHVGSYIMPNQGNIRFLHAVFGTVVICLGICNWLMALFRPHPGTPNRPIYNWAHWSVGTVAFYLALATILLGVVDYTDEPLLGGIPHVVFWVVVVFIAFHCVVWSFLQYITVCIESKGRENDMPLVDDGDEMEKSPINGSISTSTDDYDDAFHIRLEIEIRQATQKSARLKQTLLWVYVTGVVITVLVVVIGIIIAKED